MKLYVVRHGQTVNNKLRKVSGKAETILTNKGIEEARQAKEKLKDVNFDLVFSSPLMRARDTAKEITDNDIIIDQRLIERDYGLNEEMPIENTNPKELWDYDLNYGDHQGETVQEILNRVHILLEDLKNKYQDKTILLVTHSGVARAIYYSINGIPEDGNLMTIDVPNCGNQIYEL